MTKFSPGNTRAAKLSNELIYEMRRLYNEGGYSQGQLAKHFGIHINTVGRIVRGETRMNVEAPPAPLDHAAVQARLLKVQEEESPILAKLRSDTQKVYDKEVRLDKELDKLKSE